MSWKKVKLGDLLEYYSVRAKDVGSSTDLEFCGVSKEDGITISKYAAEDEAEEYKVIEKGCFAYNPYRINVGSIALILSNPAVGWWLILLIIFFICCKHSCSVLNL